MVPNLNTSDWQTFLFKDSLQTSVFCLQHVAAYVNSNQDMHINIISIKTGFLCLANFCLSDLIKITINFAYLNKHNHWSMKWYLFMSTEELYLKCVVFSMHHMFSQSLTEDIWGKWMDGDSMQKWTQHNKYIKYAVTICNSILWVDYIKWLIICVHLE